MRHTKWRRAAGRFAAGLTVVCLLLSACLAHGQCPGGMCPVSPEILQQPQIHLPRPNQPTPAWRYDRAESHKAAVCRITCEDSSWTRSIGSGVLVRYRGKPVVLTAHHVVRDARKVSVRLSNGQSYAARILSRDPNWDVAVLDIGTPEGVEPAELACGQEAMQQRGNRLESCGLGSDGRLAVNSGLFLGYRRRGGARGSPTDWMALSGRARQGDSGGPIFDSSGRVVGVLWGTNGAEVIGVQAGRLHLVLAQAVPRPEGPQVASPSTPRPLVPVTMPGCPGGGLFCRPRQPPPAPSPAPPPLPAPSPGPQVIVHSDPAINRRLDTIQEKLDQIAGYTAPAEEPSEPPEEGFSPLLAGLVVLGSAVGGFGLYFGTQKG